MDTGSSLGAGNGAPEVRDSLAAALQTGEGQQVEFMACLPDNRRELTREIAALATCGGGTIYLGVDDDGSLCGEPQLAGTPSLPAMDNMRETILGAARAVCPAVRVVVEFVTQADGVVVAVVVPPGAEPIYYHGSKPYIRDGSRSRPAEPEEVKELHYEHFTRVQAAATGTAQEAAAERNRVLTRAAVGALDVLTELDAT